MSKLRITSISVLGFGSQPVPSRLYKHEQATGLALIFPGLRYTCDMPLLYYLTQALLDQGYDVLQLHSDYTTETIKALSPAERLNVMVADAQAALETAYSNRGYSKLILAGKSIGTLPLAMLISSGAVPDADCIWLTPLLHYPFVVDAALQHMGHALFIASRADETFEPDSMEQIKHQSGANVLVFEEVDHSLLSQGNTLTSIEIIGQVVHAYIEFLEGLLP